MFHNEDVDGATCLSHLNSDHYCGNSSSSGGGGNKNMTGTSSVPTTPPPAKIRNNANTTTDNLKVYSATFGTKKRIIDFIEKLNSTQEATNHSLGFKFAFALLKQLYHDTFVDDTRKTEPLPITFLYVTRGLLFPLTEAKLVMDTICQGQATLPFPVQINVCAQIIDEKRVMYEKQFLTDIVQQNYSKYGVDTPSWLANKRVEGDMYTLKVASDVQPIAMTIFTKFYEANYSLDQNLIIHSSIIDAYSKGKLTILTNTFYLWEFLLN